MRTKTQDELLSEISIKMKELNERENELRKELREIHSGKSQLIADWELQTKK